MARPGRWLLPVLVLLALATGGTAVVTATPTDSSVLVAQCSASPSNVNTYERVTLDASNSDASVIHFDKKGDGQYNYTDETDFVVNVSYYQADTYYPQVKDGQGNVAQCGQVVVNARPNANFTTSPQPGVAGKNVTFDASNSTDPDGNIVEYRWDWNGDERIDENTTVPVVNHTYYQNGTKYPLLQVVDDDGARGYAGHSIQIVAPTVKARCSVSPTTTVVGQNVTIDASDSENASYLDYDFDGDGQYDRYETRNFRINHSYAETGTYTPVIRVHGPMGGTDTAECPSVTVERANTPPQAAFTYTPRPGVAGQSMTFDASNSADSDGTIDHYEWDWNGDGTYERTTTDPRIDHTFFASDFQNVALRVVDDGNASATTTRDVQVVEPTVTARCTVAPTTRVVGQPVTIDARESENASYLDYDFDGDGQYDRYETQEFTMSHSYDQPGTYTPVIRVYSSTGQTDTAECPSVTVRPENAPPEASFTYTPDPGVAGQSMTFDASNSVDPDGSIVTYRWDFNGDGSYEETTSDPQIEHTLSRTGFANVGLQVVDDDGATRQTSRDVQVVAPTIDATCTVEPATVAPDENVTITVEQSDNASYLDYDFDGDGTYDRYETREFTMSHAYAEPGTYSPVVRIYTNTGDRQVVECRAITVAEPNQPPTAAFTTSPGSPTTDENVTFDATNSTDPDGQIVTYGWDWNGDGTIDENTSGPVVTHTYDDSGSKAPRLVVFDDDGASDEATAEFSVEKKKGELLPPWWPVVPAGLGALGLGGLLYNHFGGGGKPTPKPHPHPHGTEGGGQYETGVFELPNSSGMISVPVGFEPDLIRFSAANGARTDTATDRTAGWSRGIAHRTEDGFENQCLTVADDAHATDQATCAADDDVAIQIVRHEADGPPGRVTAAVTETTSDGFDVDVSIPGSDPMAGGIRVLYQAFRTGSKVDVEAGTVMTPTEPGTQTVELGIDADHVSLATSAAVSDDDQLWTTDRGVGVSVGHAVAEPETSLSQAVGGTSTWPGSGHPTAGVADDTEVLHLLYQDGDHLAGRTSASVIGLGETLRLQYDRVYNGPHKLGSTARHPLSYLAMAGGETMRPAVGTFSLPSSETRTIDCGFEPAMIELTIAPAPLGEEVATGATPYPFGWSQGTAIATGDRLRQYVLHHAAVPEQPPAEATAGATAAGSTTARASTDGGRDAAVPDRIPSLRETDVQPRERQTAARSSLDTETGTAPAAIEHPDDELAGLWLATDPDGTVVGRDELRVTGVTETGFRATVESVDTDVRRATGDRPTVVYRAWPAAGSDRRTSDTTSADDGEQSPTTPSETTEGQR
ncbi:MAG: PKD domain-containing protein [Halapricum sp.]